MAEPAPRLAVVVLTWEGREDTLRCLEALRPEVRPGDAVLVCDNGSTDGTVETLRRAHPWAEVIENGSNLGFAGGNNAGMRRALERGFRWVMLLNNDAVVQPGFLETLLAFAETRPKGGAFQPLLLSAADPGRIDTLGIRVLRSPGARDDAMGAPASAAPAEPREVFGACAAAALYRADALRDAGLLDEEFFLLFEDADLAFRLRAAGFEAWLVPAARVHHRRGVSGGARDPAASRRRLRFLHRNIVALALRWWPAVPLLLAAPRLAALALRAVAASPPPPAPPCMPLWRKALAARGASRRAARERGVDRWLA